MDTSSSTGFWLCKTAVQKAINTINAQFNIKKKSRMYIMFCVLKLCENPVIVLYICIDWKLFEWSVRLRQLLKLAINIELSKWCDQFDVYRLRVLDLAQQEREEKGEQSEKIKTLATYCHKIQTLINLDNTIEIELST